MNNYEQLTLELRQVRIEGYKGLEEERYFYYKLQQKWLVQSGPSYKGQRQTNLDIWSPEFQGHVDNRKTWGGSGFEIKLEDMEYIPIKEEWRWIPEVSNKDILNYE